MNNLLLSILLPAVSALVIFTLPKKSLYRELLTLVVTVLSLVLSLLIYGQDLIYIIPWGGGFGFSFSLKLYSFSSFMLTATAGFTLLIVIYSIYFMKGKKHLSQYYAYILITLAQVNGVLLSDNLILMLFFWEGLLLTLFGFIAIGGENSFKTAVKAFVINGLGDICLMAGIGLAGYLAGTYTISEISLSTEGLGTLAFILLLIGAIAKAGSMPFHSWIPNAATDAPLTFMAFIPASLEKIVGIYFLYRICLDMFSLDPSSWLSTLMMIIGSITIILAVMMALIQKDFKKLLSYHAISQVGYMVLGIGTAIPAGIIGGLFHMINNAIYKQGLFMTGGVMEKQVGTTDLKKLGGLGSKMPVTAISFIILALAISGAPLMNGFYSKELIYDGALHRNFIFYLAAIVGTFLTGASFLKLGHASFFGKISNEHKNVKDAHWTMLLPIVVLAGFSIFFGVYNMYPVDTLIKPVLGDLAGDAHYSGLLPHNWVLASMAVLALLLAYFNHRYGVKKTGMGVGAVDHIHHAKIFSASYDKAEAGKLDPYNWGMGFVNKFSYMSFKIDKANDWFYNKLVVSVTNFISLIIRKAHNGNYSTYIIWSFVGLLILIIFFVKSSV